MPTPGMNLLADSLVSRSLRRLCVLAALLIPGISIALDDVTYARLVQVHPGYAKAEKELAQAYSKALLSQAARQRTLTRDSQRQWLRDRNEVLERLRARSATEHETGDALEAITFQRIVFLRRQRNASTESKVMDTAVVDHGKRLPQTDPSPRSPDPEPLQGTVAGSQSAVTPLSGLPPWFEPVAVLFAGGLALLALYWKRDLLGRALVGVGFGLLFLLLIALWVSLNVAIVYGVYFLLGDVAAGVVGLYFLFQFVVRMGSRY